jgi:hypothetical protein
VAVRQFHGCAVLHSDAQIGRDSSGMDAVGTQYGKHATVAADVGFSRRKAV